MTTEVLSRDWAEFFLKFNELNKGSLITVEHQNLEGHTKEIAREMPFEGIRFGKDACNDNITIGLGSAPGARDRDHLVVEPIHVRIRGEQAGRKQIQIEAENGVTIITFHNGRFPMEMEGLQSKQVPEKTGREQGRIIGVQGREKP